MARRRGGRKAWRTTAAWSGVLVTIAASVYLWCYGAPWSASAESGVGYTGPVRSALTSDRPASETSVDPFPNVAEKGALAQDSKTPFDAPANAARSRELIAAARIQNQNGNLVAARQQFSEAMKTAAGGSEEADIRAELVRLGEQTVFSLRIFPEDPLVGAHIVQPGETLEKIGRANDVTAALLARVNGIADVNKIRIGQSLKVVKGPFTIKVRKGAYRMDVFVQDTFVQSFPVGLGAEDGTPSGSWRVNEKLKNPTYYPPHSGTIVSADDPKNPLGERWIGLEGVGGGAVGQMRYGIHGTIDPSSIAKSVSMGCIRMHNADVELLYDLLIPVKSAVEVVE